MHFEREGVRFDIVSMRGLPVFEVMVYRGTVSCRGFSLGFYSFLVILTDKRRCDIGIMSGLTKHLINL